MADQHFADQQRLAFGRVAELYDRARPSYPASVVDAVIDFGALRAPARILEIGAGTGKATALFAERGLGVVALEPSADMARVARANCERYPSVEIVQREFESWRPAEPLAACLSAQAWHWIAPEVRYERAHAALVPGGMLAAIWTFPDWERCALRGSISAAYHNGAPQLEADFPMHPDSRPTRLAGDWDGEIRAGGLFTDPIVRTFPWSQRYSSAQYGELLQTHQDHILLGDDDRTRLLSAVAGAIDQAGGTLTMRFVTHVCLARRGH